MGGCLSCLVGTNHLICCSIISFLGSLFFFIMLFVLMYQPEFLQFQIKKLNETKGAVALSMAFYLIFFIGVSTVLFLRFRKQRQINQPVGGYRRLQQQNDRYRQVRSMEIRQE